MDILDKAYDYMDYTLSELSRLEENCVSLLYFFKVFSPAGALAQKLLLDHGLIEVEKKKNLSVVGITDRGREVVAMGGVRQYLDYLDEQTAVKKVRVRKVRRLLTWAACLAAGVVITGITLKK